MSEPVARVRTPIPETALLAHIHRALELELGRVPTWGELGVAYALASNETRQGKAVWNNNIGNVSTKLGGAAPHFKASWADDPSDPRYQWAPKAFLSFSTPQQGAVHYVKTLRRLAPTIMEEASEGNLYNVGALYCTGYVGGCEHHGASASTVRDMITAKLSEMGVSPEALGSPATPGEKPGAAARVAPIVRTVGVFGVAPAAIVAGYLIGGRAPAAGAVLAGLGAAAFTFGTLDYLAKLREPTTTTSADVARGVAAVATGGAVGTFVGRRAA